MSKLLSRLPIFKELAIIVWLSLIILFVNYNIIHYDMMYPEQTYFYIANQGIKNIWDLINIYLHPKLFHTAVPFFRPSGHFLMYQLFIPFIGWYNTKALIIINLLFLSLTAYMMVKIYQLLFPRFHYGAYVAIAIYIMHPALILTRLISMHFEFAHVFFILLSLYYFIQFTEYFFNYQHNASFTPFSLRKLILSLLYYAVAVTFKEPALMLGPVLFIYFFIQGYCNASVSKMQSPLSSQPRLKTCRGWDDNRRFDKVANLISICMNKQILRVFVILISISLVLFFYIKSAWPTLEHPMRHYSSKIEVSVIKEFILMLFFARQDPHYLYTYQSSNIPWCTAIFPFLSRLILSIFIVLTSFSLVHLFIHNRLFKISITFLMLAALIFLVLPLGWGRGLPWHLSLTILSFSFMMGFSCEYFLLYILEMEDKMLTIFLLLISLLVLAVTPIVNKSNIAWLNASPIASVALKLNYNAIFHAKILKQNINANSLIIIEDKNINNDYLIGGGMWPFILRAKEERLLDAQRFFYLPFRPHFNGYLFKWAYNLPTLKEESYPFHVKHMDSVADYIIYIWLRYQNNIYCFSYDKNANWIDKTTVFKRNLLAEKIKRNLNVSSYQHKKLSASTDTIYHSERIPIADSKMCQFICDQDKSCGGFNYINLTSIGSAIIQCNFIHKVDLKNLKECASCTTFTKVLG